MQLRAAKCKSGHILCSLKACDTWDAAVLSGVDQPDTGVVRNRGIRIGYLPQVPELDEGLSAIDAVLASDSLLARCLRNYDQAMAGGNQKVWSPHR